MGWAKCAAAAVEGAGVPVSFDAFVSVGLCGALIDEANVGMIVLGSTVNGFEAQEPRTDGGLPLAVRSLPSIVLQAPAQKAETARNWRNCSGNGGGGSTRTSPEREPAILLRESGVRYCRRRICLGSELGAG
ncbi:MAG: hypothetical protein WKF37_11480 [Bryobacteraceae bacterium]